MGLYDYVCKREALREAYRLAKRNNGSPGIDGVTLEVIEAEGLEGFLDQLREELVQRELSTSAGTEGGDTQGSPLSGMRRTAASLNLALYERCFLLPSGSPSPFAEFCPTSGVHSTNRQSRKTLRAALRAENEREALRAKGAGTGRGAY